MRIELDGSSHFPNTLTVVDFLKLVPELEKVVCEGIGQMEVYAVYS